MRHTLGAPTTAQKAVAALVEKELVEMTDGEGYQIPNRLLRQWIARYRQTKEVLPAATGRARS